MQTYVDFRLNTLILSTLSNLAKGSVVSLALLFFHRIGRAKLRLLKTKNNIIWSSVPPLSAEKNLGWQDLLFFDAKKCSARYARDRTERAGKLITTAPSAALKIAVPFIELKRNRKPIISLIIDLSYMENTTGEILPIMTGWNTCTQPHHVSHEPSQGLFNAKDCSAKNSSPPEIVVQLGDNSPVRA
jgi:hypothetical protein